MNRSLILVSIIISLFLSACKGYRHNLYQGPQGLIYARKNAIIDFANTYKTSGYYLKIRKGEEFKVFLILKNKTSNEKYGFSITPEINNFTLKLEDTIGRKDATIPTGYAIEKDKLFLWYDESAPVSQQVLDVMDKHEVLDSVDIRKELGLLPDDYVDERMYTMDDGLKGVDYYICKKNIKKYKKVKTNRAFGYYTPPKLNCK